MSIEDPFEKMARAINANAEAAAKLDAAAKAISASANTTSAEARNAAESVRAAVAGLTPEGAAKAFSEALAGVKRDAGVIAAAAERVNQTAETLRWAAWESLFRYALYVGGALMAFSAFVAVYRWWEEPKIEEKLYGCTGAYVTKTNTCKGKWIPLQRNDGN